MERHLTFQQLNTLRKVAVENGKSYKKGLPVVMKVGNQAALPVIGCLPYFLGKGILIGSKRNTFSLTPEKPILVLATSAISFVKLSVVFGEESFLVKNGILQCKENGVPYTTYIIPSASVKKPDKHDLILGGIHHFQWFPKDFFTAIIVLESNLLSSALLKNIVLYFNEIKTVLFEVYVNVQGDHCKSISSQRLNDILLDSDSDREDNNFVYAIKKSTSTKPLQYHQSSIYQNWKPTLHDMASIELNNQTSSVCPPVKTIYNEQEKCTGKLPENPEENVTAFDQLSQEMIKHIKKELINQVERGLKSSSNDLVELPGHFPFTSVEQNSPKCVQVSKNYQLNLPVTPAIAHPVPPLSLCTSQCDIHPSSPCCNPNQPVQNYCKNLMHLNVLSPTLTKQSRMSQKKDDDGVSRMIVRTVPLVQQYPVMCPIQPQVLPHIQPSYQNSIYPPNIQHQDHLWISQPPSYMQCNVCPQIPQSLYSRNQAQWLPNDNQFVLACNHPVPHPFQPPYPLNQHLDYSVNGHISNTWPYSPNMSSPEQLYIHSWQPLSSPSLQPGDNSWASPFGYTKICTVQQPVQSMHSNFHYLTNSTKLNSMELSSNHCPAKLLSSFQQVTISPYFQHQYSEPISKSINNQPNPSQQSPRQVQSTGYLNCCQPPLPQYFQLTKPCPSGYFEQTQSTTIPVLVQPPSFIPQAMPTNSGIPFSSTVYPPCYLPSPKFIYH